MSTPGNEKRPPTRRPGPPVRFSALWFAGALLLLLMVGNIVQNVVGTGDIIQYSQFKTLVNEGRVESVTITPQAIRGNYQTPEKTVKTFSTTPVNDP